MKKIVTKSSLSMRFLMGLLAICLASPNLVLSQEANPAPESTRVKAAVTVTSGIAMDSIPPSSSLFSRSQNKISNDYPSRKSVVVNFCPYLHIKALYFYNDIHKVGSQLSWSNIGAQPIIALEVATVEYNPVGEAVTSSGDLLFSGIVIPGNGLGNLNPLQPAEYASGAFGKPDVNRYTVAVYVKSVRLADGKIWRANKLQIDSAMAAALLASR